MHKYTALAIAITLLACGAEGNAQDEQRQGGSMSPTALVREYVERDASGERLQTAPWFLEVVVWPEDPAFDSYTVIAGFDVGPAVTQGDTVYVPVVYQRIGWIESTGDSARLILSDTTEHHRFVVANLGSRWLIAAPRLGPHVMADTVLSRTPLVARDRASLAAILSRAGKAEM